MMIRNTFAAAMTAFVLLAATGCAVQRGQQTVGAYVDDAAITTSIKAKFVENKVVAANAISVETLNGTVLLSGFAKSNDEKNTAHQIAHDTKGVKAVRDEVVVRP
jgi:hyperosmotically inducible protein